MCCLTQPLFNKIEMTKAEYIEQVLLRMNQASQEGLSSIIGSDTTQGKTFITNTFSEAWRRTVEFLPEIYFPQKSFSGTTPNLPDGIGTITIPSDFEKFVSLKMVGWKIPALYASSNTEPIAQQQANENTRGSWIRPIVVINDLTTLTYYSLPKWYTNHLIEYGKYIPKATLPESDSATIEIISGVSISGKFAEPLMWMNAAIVFDIFGKNEQSKLCKENFLNK